MALNLRQPSCDQCSGLENGAEPKNTFLNQAPGLDSQKIFRPLGLEIGPEPQNTLLDQYPSLESGP